jgi:hypothetical protein
MNEKTPCLLIAACLLMILAVPAFCQDLRPLKSEFLTESGCPVDAADTPRAELEFDAEKKPIAARQYLDYKNISQKVIVAVKFRIGFVDAKGMATVFSGVETQQLSPGQSAWQRWRSDLSAPAKSAKIRVLAVKFADGTIWQSEKAGPPTANNGSSPRQSEEANNSTEQAPSAVPRQPQSGQPSSRDLSSRINGSQPSAPGATNFASADPGDVPPAPPVPEPLTPI